MGDGHPADRILEFSDRLFNIHIEDMRRSVHEHLEFGQGEMDIARIMRALDEINYVGPVNVELSRHSHDAVNTARRAFKFLAKWP
jgi:sugar phosphate isomerase/epimerase